MATPLKKGPTDAAPAKSVEPTGMPDREIQQPFKQLPGGLYTILTKCGVRRRVMFQIVGGSKVAVGVIGRACGVFGKADSDARNVGRVLLLDNDDAKEIAAFVQAQF